MKKTTQVIQEPELDSTEFIVENVRKVNVTVRGTRPLLMNRYIGNLERIDKTPEAEAKEKLYLQDGKLVQPAEHFEKAMERVASGVKIPGEGKKTYKDWIKAFVTVEPMFIVHKNQHWEIDTRAIKNPATKGRNPRHRPMLNNWELSFQLLIKNPRLELAKVEKILRLAGEFNGIGDYRPKFGLFEVTKFEPLQ